MSIRRVASLFLCSRVREHRGVDEKLALQRPRAIAERATARAARNGNKTTEQESNMLKSKKHQKENQLFS